MKIYDVARRGFTLAELSIVLLVAAFLLGAIWIASDGMWERYLLYRTSKDLTQSVQGIREYYMNAQTVPAGNQTLFLDGQGIYPVEMRRQWDVGPGNTSIDNPFNDTWAAPGSFQVTGGIGAALRVERQPRVFASRYLGWRRENASVF